jgi:hypothetical protein
VLRKLGFRPTGAIVDRFSVARGETAPCKLFELDLAEETAERPTRELVAAEGGVCPVQRTGAPQA